MDNRDILANRDPRVTTGGGASAPVRPSFMSRLAFESAPLRIGIELALCFVLFEALRSIIDQSNPNSGMQNLSAWFVACSVVAVADYFIFVRPQLVLRKSFILSLAGHPTEALAAMELVGPTQKSDLIPCPEALYRYQRAQIFMFAERWDEALMEAQLAKRAGLSTEKLQQLRLEVFRRKGDFDRLRTKLSRSRALSCDEAILAFEEGLLILSARNDFRSQTWSVQISFTRSEQHATAQFKGRERHFRRWRVRGNAHTSRFRARQQRKRLPEIES